MRKIPKSSNTNKRNKSIIIFGLISLIIIILGGVLIYSRYTLKQESSVNKQNISNKQNDTNKPKLSFKLENGWTDKFEPYNGATRDILSIEKDNHVIRSYIQDLGGGLCIYDDTPSKDIPMQYQDQPVIDSYIEIKTSAYLLRRQLNTNTIDDQRMTFSICRQEPSGLYSTFPFNKIFIYSVPKNYSEKLLEEMDKILSTFEFIH